MLCPHSHTKLIENKSTVLEKKMCNAKSGFKQPFNWFITKHGQKHKPKIKIKLWYKYFRPINKVIWKKKEITYYFFIYSSTDRGGKKESSWTKSAHGILKSTICSGERKNVLCSTVFSISVKKINIYWKVQIYDEEQSLSYCIWCNVRHGLTRRIEGTVKQIKDTGDRVLNKWHHQSGWNDVGSWKLIARLKCFVTL